jgi:hypothetical protein
VKKHGNCSRFVFMLGFGKWVQTERGEIKLFRDTEDIFYVCQD